MTFEEFAALAQEANTSLAAARQAHTEADRLASEAARGVEVATTADGTYTSRRAAARAAFEELFPETPGSGGVGVQASAPTASRSAAPAAGWPSLPPLPSPERLAELYRQLQAALTLLRTHLGPQQSP